MPQRRRPALVVLLAAIVGLSGCGSGADVGEEFGKDAAAWPGVVKAWGGGSRDLPGGGRAEGTLVVAPDASRVLMQELAARAQAYVPSGPGPRRMTTVVIERGGDAVEVGDSAEVAAARIEALLALRGEGEVGEMSIGTDAGDERVEVRAQDTPVCEQPRLFERVRSLAMPRATGGGPLGVSVFAYGNTPVLSARAGVGLPAAAVAAWELLCPPGEPVNTLRLIDDTLSVEAIQASDLEAVRSRLLEGSLAGLKIKLGYIGKQPVSWDPAG